MKNKKTVREWMTRAKSNYKRATEGRPSPEVMYEDICFDIQQAAEKSLKALIIGMNAKLPRTHNISHLLDILLSCGLEIPEDIEDARILTSYAVEFRYPGDYDPINEKEYQEALDILHKLFHWVNQCLSNMDNDSI